MNSTADQNKSLRHLYVGLQPVYNSGLGVFAYSLFYRSPTKKLSEISSDAATSQLVIDAFQEIGIDRLVGNRFAVIPASPWFLQTAQNLPIPPHRIILDIPCNTSVSSPLGESISALSKLGYKIAVDTALDAPEINPLVTLADIVRVDVSRLPLENLRQAVRELKKLGKPLLALKVETLGAYELYRDMGFTYSQGFFLSRPRVVKSTKLSDNKLAILRLLSTLLRPDADTTKISAAINQDVSLSYKLLKLINSPFFGLSRDITSVHQAVVLLGRDALKSWGAALVLTNIDEKPPELTRISITRARMCQLLAERMNQPEPDSYFLAGMFSTLDALMDRPIESVLKPLPVSNDIKEAVLNGRGDMGAAVECAVAYEQCRGESIQCPALSTSELTAIYFSAFHWASHLLEGLGASSPKRHSSRVQAQG